MISIYHFYLSLSQVSHQPPALPWALVITHNITEFTAYCLKMAKTAAWGGQVELLALSRLLNRPIEVRDKTGGGEREGR